MIKPMDNYRIVNIMGGLGNQMFIYAFSLALKNKKKDRILYDISSYKYDNLRSYELDLFNLKLELATEEQIEKVRPKKTFLGKLRNSYYKRRWRFKDFKIVKMPAIEEYYSKYNPNFFDCKTLRYYSCYFQNEKYFSDVEEDVRQAFIFPDFRENIEENKKMLEKIKNSNSVFLHVRRGDYKGINWVLDTNYYKKAVKYMKETLSNPVFFVFSDEIEEIDKTFLEDVNCVFMPPINKGKSSWQDMCLMSNCKHAICANSSFSWWAAWLIDNKEKVVTAPSPWIMGNDDIICESWVKIKY